jgi:hypothetical protein
MSKNLKPSSQCAKAARTAQTVLSQLTRAFYYTVLEKIQRRTVGIVTGTEVTFPRGKETPCGYGSNFQDCEGN